MASRTLYPVSVDSTQSAFVYKKDAETICKIYFTISPFNSDIIQNKIKYDTDMVIDSLWAHVTVFPAEGGLSIVNDIDKTNEKMLIDETEKVSPGYTATQVILDLPVYYNEEIERCYVNVSSDYLKEGYFAIDKAYKFHIRLAQTSYADIVEQSEKPPTQEQFISFETYSSTFSEWSTVTLAVCIGEPKINFTNISSDGTYSSKLLNLQGTFSCEDSKEALARYRFSLYERNMLVEETDWIENRTSLNTVWTHFNYTFKQLLKQTSYALLMEYETVNHYSSNELLFINAKPMTDNNFIFNSELDIFNDEEEGIFTFSIDYTGSNEYISYDIYRLKESNNEWEFIDTIKDLSLIYADYTLESGQVYTYGINAWSENGNSIFTDFDNKVIRRFNYSYLLGENGQQLKLPFNNEMSSYKINVADQMLTTIGSPYPYINRVSSIYYRTIPINALISMQMDENNMFISSDEYTSDVLKEYNKKCNISSHYDYISERNFREYVMKFLLNGKPKLFKSTTEGNILVRLMDVNFVPNQQLSRMIYSFTSTGQEIGEYSTEKLKKYNIIPIKINEIKEKENHTTHLKEVLNG